MENILTDAMFMRSGRIVLHQSMEAISQRYQELHVVGQAVADAQAMGPISERSILGGKAMIFEDTEMEGLQALGELHTPSIADLFIAKMEQGAA